jgi:hypothetical protein
MVSFYEDGALLGPSALAGGVATYNTPGLAAGTHLFQAQYPGSATLTASSSGIVQVAATAQNLLTVTAQNAARNFATANPAFTYSIAGFVNGDTVSVVTGAPMLTTTATLNSTAGTYPIAAAMGTLSAPANYVFGFVGGTLTVNPGAPQTITFMPIPAVSFAAVQQLALTAHSTSGLPIAYTVTSGPATISGSTLQLTGAGAVTVTASQAGNSTFAPAAPVAQSFTVTP